MAIQFRPAKRDSVSLLIQMAGGTGSGKTYSAMRLAAGIAGPDRPFAVIDTEAERAKHYADFFRFDYADMTPPFRPEAYLEAIQAADKAGYPVIVVDSMSHEWAGEGGVIDWHDEELTRMAGGDWKKREVCNIAAWIKPKGSHKKMMSRLLQVRAHLIFCLRAEEKIAIERITDEKTGREKNVIVPQGWQPICEKNFPFEMTASFLLTHEAPGIPQPLKLQEQHRGIFPDGQQIDEETGRRLAEWASGASAAAAVPDADIIAAMTDQIQGLSSEESLEKWWGSHAPALTSPAVKEQIVKACSARRAELKNAA